MAAWRIETALGGWVVGQMRRPGGCFKLCERCVFILVFRLARLQVDPVLTKGSENNFVSQSFLFKPYCISLPDQGFSFEEVR